MTEIEATVDAVRLSFLRAVLTEARIDFTVFDANIGATWPGAFPARVMVPDIQAWIARRAIIAADADLAEPR